MTQTRKRKPEQTEEELLKAFLEKHFIPEEVSFAAAILITRQSGTEVRLPALACIGNEELEDEFERIKEYIREQVKSSLGAVSEFIIDEWEIEMAGEGCDDEHERSSINFQGSVMIEDPSNHIPVGYQLGISIREVDVEDIAADQTIATIAPDPQTIIEHLKRFLLDHRVPAEGTYMAIISIERTGCDDEELPVLLLINDQSIEQTVERIKLHIDQQCLMHSRLSAASNIILDDWTIESAEEDAAHLTLSGTMLMDDPVHRHGVWVYIHEAF